MPEPPNMLGESELSEPAAQTKGECTIAATETSKHDVPLPTNVVKQGQLLKYVNFYSRWNNRIVRVTHDKAASTGSLAYYLTEDDMAEGIMKDCLNLAEVSSNPEFMKTKPSNLA